MRLKKSMNTLTSTQQKVVHQERLSALGQMASGIAHDFNNVLMPIVNLSELLLSDPTALDDREETRRILKVILSAGNDAFQIVHRLRAICRSDDDTECEFVDSPGIVERARFSTTPERKEKMRA